MFFFNQQRNTEVFNLTEAALKERLAKEFEGNADAIFETYHKSRPDASPSDLYIAITTARMIAIGATTIAERKSAQRSAAHRPTCTCSSTRIRRSFRVRNTRWARPTLWRSRTSSITCRCRVSRSGTRRRKAEMPAAG